MGIPVIINNRDIFTWAKNMVDCIGKFHSLSEIIIIDNASTYEPLLDWYSTNPCRVIKLKDNLGHYAPWNCGFLGDIDTGYVVTDPDLGLDELPLDVLEFLQGNISGLDKIGLGLDWQSVKQSSPYYHYLNNYEKQRWDSSRVDGLVYKDVAIDTTFAYYPKGIKHYFIGGASTGFPYIAKHMPWYYSVEEREADLNFMYYLQHASSSCSYKRFL